MGARGEVTCVAPLYLVMMIDFALLPTIWPSIAMMVPKVLYG